jgi:hypothetical protein
MGSLLTLPQQLLWEVERVEGEQWGNAELSGSSGSGSWNEMERVDGGVVAVVCVEACVEEDGGDNLLEDGSTFGTAAGAQGAG